MSCLRNNRLLSRLHSRPAANRTAFLLFTAYATNRKKGNAVTNNYHEEAQPVRKIPTREQIAHSSTRTGNRSKQQNIPQQAASRHRIGHETGLHPEDQRYLTGDMHVADEYELEEDDTYYPTRPPTSSIRYQGYEVSPEQVYQQGNQRYHVRYVDVPTQRKSRQAQLPPQRERHTDEYEARQRVRLHPLAWVGLFGVFLVLGWFGLNAVTNWYQGVQNDWTYGQQRHFEINTVVGHSDSATNPSHFTAENNNGQIIVIELPGNNDSKAKIYQIETVPGNTGNPPVKLSFQDMNGDGKPDMIVQIGDGNAMIFLTLWNNGTEFVSKL